jgi:uncharacterized membrane protein
MRIVEQIEVKAPIVDCYAMGIAFERYADIFSNIKSVTQKGAPGVWHWKVEGPGGQLLEWDMELKGEKHSNQVISWHTVRQGDIAHSGAITFNRIDAATTHVQLVVEYSASSNTYPTWEAEFEPYGQQIAQKSLQSFKDLAEAKRRAVTASL